VLRPDQVEARRAERQGRRLQQRIFHTAKIPFSHQKRHNEQLLLLPRVRLSSKRACFEDKPLKNRLPSSPAPHFEDACRRAHAAGHAGGLFLCPAASSRCYRCPISGDIGNEIARFHARCPRFWDICNGNIQDSASRNRKRPKLALAGVLKPGSAPKTGKNSAEIHFCRRGAGAVGWRCGGRSENRGVKYL
jgi:hypothetical protein